MNNKLSADITPEGIGVREEVVEVIVRILL